MGLSRINQLSDWRAMQSLISLTQAIVRRKMARFSGALWQWVMVVLLIALLEGASAVSICDIDSAQLNYCRPAVSGKSSTPPSKKCCGVVRQADLPCLCNYKAVLPSFGIDPAQAMALPKKCGVKTPPECVA